METLRPANQMYSLVDLGQANIEQDSQQNLKKHLLSCNKVSRYFPKNIIKSDMHLKDVHL